METFECPWCGREDVTFKEIKKDHNYVGIGNCNMCGALATEPSKKLIVSNELKTLKDLELRIPNVIMSVKESQDTGVSVVTFKELKAEAVKWLTKPNMYEARFEEEDLEKWIKHFFNLTEEDLKNG